MDVSKQLDTGIEIKNEGIKINDLLEQIERGDIPVELIVTRLLELVIKLDEKEQQLDSLIKSFPMLNDISRKINEIHTIHFPAKELKKKTQKDRFMSQILMGPTRKI